MDGHSGFHRRFLNKRQGLGVLGGILGGGPTPSSVSPSAMTPPASQSPAGPLGLGGIVGGLTSLVGAAPSLLLPLGPSSATASSTSLTHSSSSTGSTTTSTTSKVTSTSSTTTSSTTSSTPTSTPTPTPTPSDVVYTSTQGPNIVYITSTPAASPTAAAPKSFLENPSEEGSVFALVGIAALILIFVIATWTMRKRRRDRLERDLAAAVTFDPAVTDRYEEERESSIEKHRLSGSSSGHGHGGYGYGVQPAYAAPQHSYYGPTAYGQYPTAAPYRAPSPNTVPYQGPSPAPPQPAAQGAANLQRKFSDRKPVPPLLPTRAYDPTTTQVSLPSPFYQN